MEKVRAVSLALHSNAAPEDAAKEFKHSRDALVVRVASCGTWKDLHKEVLLLASSFLMMKHAGDLKTLAALVQNNPQWVDRFLAEVRKK